MVTVLDLMQVYQIKNGKAGTLDYLVDIINQAGVNALIDRESLALEILRQCGTRDARYNTSEVFARFAVNFFKREKSYIDRTLLLLAKEYDALDTYSISREEKIDRKHTEDIDEQRVDDLETERTDNLTTTRTDNLTDTRTDNLTATRTDNLTERKTGSYTDEHFVSAENESGVMLRTRDTHTDTDPAGSGTLNTGTQTNANTGTQTNAATGTQTHADTGTQTTTNTGSVHNTGLNEFTHDDKIIIGEHGYKISPNVEFFNALKRNEFNIYAELAEKFSDEMCLCVF